MQFSFDTEPDPDANDPNLHAELLRFSEWGRRPRSWLWFPILLRRRVTILVGDHGIGKSLMMADIAAHLTRGEAVPPDGELREGPGDVLFVQADDEDDEDLHPRLVDFRADMSRVGNLTTEGPRHIGESNPQITFAESVQCLHRTARRMRDCRLIVIDPITAFLDGMSPYSDSNVRRLLSRLRDVAKLHNAAVVLITHTRNDGTDNILHRIVGSQAFAIVPRVVYALVKDPAKPGRRLLLPAKMNPLPQSEWVGRAFRIGWHQLKWEPQPLRFKPDELPHLISKGHLTADRVAEVVAWLKALLAEGRCPSSRIQELANQQQIPARLLLEAKARAGIRSVRDSKQNCWFFEPVPKLPAPPTPPPPPS